MRLWNVVLLFSLILFSATQVSAQAMGHGHGMTKHFLYNGLTFTYNISDADFKNTPSWNPETDDAPLATRDALDIARKMLNRFVPDGQRFEVEKINLERFEPHKWVFEVAFHCWDQRCSDTAVSFTVFVKMDGSVIEPEVTPTPKGGEQAPPNKSLDASGGSVFRIMTGPAMLE